MLSLENFVSAVQEAVAKASENLAKYNEDLFDKYFYQTDADGHVVTADTDPEKLMGQSPTLKAKSVTIEYPKETSKGIEQVEVQIPLITLSPLSMTQIEEAKVKVDFQLAVIDGQLQLQFPKANSRGKAADSAGNTGTKPAMGSVEIHIKPAEMPEGVKVVVEGYEKVLKSQVPN
ncbi:MAG: DUF2589 domain-containing protein [Salibacteraceae bacterium]